MTTSTEGTHWTRQALLGLGNPSAEFEQVLQAAPALSQIDIPYDAGMLVGLRAQVAQATRGQTLATSQIQERDREITVRDGDSIKLRVYSPADVVSPPSGLVVNYHGGGWIMGDLETSVDLCRGLVSQFHVTVVDVDYRLAPEYPFPTSINDAWDALEWIAQNVSTFEGVDPGLGFLVTGVSAGANLAAVVSNLARDHKLSPPLTGVFLSALPAISRDAVPLQYQSQWLSYEQNARAPILNRPLYDFIMNMYKPTKDSALFSPLLNPNGFAGLPPTYFAVCGMDPLRDDGIIYEQELRKAGVQTRSQVYPGLPHCWWGMLPQLQATAKYNADTEAAFRWLLKKE